MNDNVIRMSSHAATAAREPCNYQFVPGQGYIYKGPPTALKAGPRLAVLNVCEPAEGALDWSWHWLNPPGGGAVVKLQWRPATKNWHPVLGHGNRVAFTSAYLSSHGWTYNRPADG